MISDRSGDAVVHPRLLIHKESGAIVNDGPPDAAIEFCEYADGVTARIPRVPTLLTAEDAMDEPLSLSVGSIDCDSGQADPPPTGILDEIEVPAATANDPEYYDVEATFAFGARP